MNEQFKKDLMAAKKRAAIFFTLVIVAFVSLLAVIFMLFGSISFYILIPLSVFAVSVLLILIRDERPGRAAGKRADYYAFDTKKEYTYAELVEKLGSRRGLARSHTHSESSVVLSYHGNPEYRVSVIYFSEYEKAEYEKIKSEAIAEYNKKYGVRRLMTPDAEAKLMCVDIVVSDSVTEGLQKELSVLANDDLSSSPSRLRISLVGNKLLVPRVSGELLIKDLTKYEKAVEFLTCIL